MRAGAARRRGDLAFVERLWRGAVAAAGDAPEASEEPPAEDGDDRRVCVVAPTASPEQWALAQGIGEAPGRESHRTGPTWTELGPGWTPDQPRTEPG